jgi:hypothetical protein
LQAWESRRPIFFYLSGLILVGCESWLRLAGALAAFLVCRGSSCRLGIPAEVFFFAPSAFVLAVAGFGLIGCESWLRKRWRATMTLHLMYTGLGTWSLGVLLLIVSDWTFSRGVDI